MKEMCQFSFNLYLGRHFLNYWIYFVCSCCVCVCVCVCARARVCVCVCVCVTSEIFQFSLYWQLLLNRNFIFFHNSSMLLNTNQITQFNYNSHALVYFSRLHFHCMWKFQKKKNYILLKIYKIILSFNRIISKN